MRILSLREAPPPLAALLHDAREGQWLLMTDPGEVITTDHPGGVHGALRRVQDAVKGGGYAVAGWVSYEAAPAFDPSFRVQEPGSFPLVWFGLYRNVEPVELGPDLSSPHVMHWTPTMSLAEYESAIGQVREEIRAGNTYQVNFTFRLRTPRVTDPWRVFRSLVRAQGPALGAFIHHPDWIICSASPELFLATEGGRVISEPMKGTRPRGLWTAQDHAVGEELRTAVKDRSENVMIVDMVRNDLGRIAAHGDVRVDSLFDVRRYPTVWQMVSRVSAAAPSDLAGLFGALFPPASITGAPKTSTMRIIRRLETTPRRLYTGALGFILRDGRMQFNVAIRTLLVDRRTGEGEYGVGSGVVWRSDPRGEYEECLAKAAVLSASTPDFSLLETMRRDRDHGIPLLDRHLSRMRASADYFGIPFDRGRIEAAVHDAVAESDGEVQRVRLVLTPQGVPRCTATGMQQTAGYYSVRLACGPVETSELFLYHKTTNRRVYEEALRSVSGCDDVLLWNAKGELTESCIGNLILEVGGRLYTPPVACGLLPGVYRGLLIERGEVEERILTSADVRSASRILLCNALRGVWDVRVVS